MKARTLIVSALIFCLLFALAACRKTAETETTHSDDDVYMTVEGYDVTYSVYNFYRNRLKSKIMTEYAEKYGITDFSDFWSNEYDGNSPTADLESRTKEQCIEAAVILLECKKAGIYDDISWSGLKALAEKYNSTHKNSSVGLTEIDMDTFFLYYIEEGEIQLKSDFDGDFETYLADRVKEIQND